VGRIVFSLVLGWSVALSALAGATAHAAESAPLSKSEMVRLWRGETVVREQSLSRGQEHYVGGVTYTIVDANADDLPALLADVDTLKRILPRTRAALNVGSADGDELVQVTQGTALLQATYTIRLHRSAREVRFWMDPHMSHDIANAWGFFRAAPLGEGRALVTYGVLLDMGPGLLRDLFEQRVRDLALSVADRVRGLVLQRNAAGQRATR
jgi:hypothetical protein